MELRAYIRAHPGSASRLAVGLGVSPSYLSQMASGHRPIPVEACVLLEALTDMKVRRWDSRPTSWHRIWPELIGVAGAPAIPEGEEAA